MTTHMNHRTPDKTNNEPPRPFMEGIRFERQLLGAKNGRKGLLVDVGRNKDGGNVFRLEYGLKGAVFFVPTDSTAVSACNSALSHGVSHGDPTVLALRDLMGEDYEDSCVRYLFKDVLAVGDQIAKSMENDFDCRALATHLAAEWRKLNQERIERINNERKVSFIDLRYYFAAGQHVIVVGDPESEIKPEPYGAEIVKSENMTGFFGDQYMLLTVARFEQIGEDIVPRTHQIGVGSFLGTQPISSLPVRAINSDEKAALLVEGRRWYNMVKKPTYQTYNGMLKVPAWRSSMERLAKGRMMVDGAGFARFSPNHFQSVVRSWRELPNDHKLVAYKNRLNDDVLWMTSHTVYGFSLPLKKWGEFDLKYIEDVHFRNEAIQNLVIDDDRKALILALVRHSKLGFTDIVEGKGGGTIFLLHGEPGVGKTLTAEAIADELKRPLYSVSVGELGTNPVELENRLQQVLELSASWDAVLLLDEADIYLERRVTGDPVRNAMVAIFLRLLEYHNGVMFMTTNRCADFDPAFQSRISVTLEYGAMTPDKLAKVWANLLRAANIAGINAEACAALAPLNGRQVKNVIRSASILARSEGREVTMNDIQRVVPLVGGIGIKQNRAIDG